MGLGDMVWRWPGRHRSPLALALVLAAAGTVSSAALTQTSNPAAHRSGSAAVASAATSSPANGEDGLPASVTRVGRPRADARTAVAEPAVHVPSTVRTGAVDPRVTSMLLDAYRSAVAGSAPSCHLQVSLLAAIGQVESGSLVGRRLDSKGRTSVLGPVLDGKGGVAAVPDTDHGRWDGNTRWDRALGAMQLLPSTVRAFGVDGDRDGVVDPQDVYDATATAAAYLCYGGRDLADPAVLDSAILAYNHSTAYRDLVLTYRSRYAGLGLDQVVADPGLVTSLQSSALSATPTRQPAPAAAPARTGRTVVETADEPRPGHASARNTGSTNTGKSGSGTPHGGTPSASGRPSAGSTSTASTPTPSTTGRPTPTPHPTHTQSATPTGTPTQPPSCPTPTTSPSGTPTPTASPTDPTATCPPCEPAPTPTDTATPTPTATPTQTAGDPSEVCSAVSSDASESAGATP